MAAPHPAPSSDSCSSRSLLSHEPLAGSAPERHTWLAIEQPGPWGHDAWRTSHLPVGMPEGFPELAAAHGVGVLLIRRPGRHADTHRAGPRTILLATVQPSQRALRRFVVSSNELPERVGALDVTAAGLAAEGAFPPAESTWLEMSRPTVLVCTHARRDTCCALSGRGLLDALTHHPQAGADQSVDVWESSHLGGHRFAPTALLLPSGLMLGRASVDDLAEALAGRLPATAARGHTWRPAHAQVAETVVTAAAANAGHLHITSTLDGSDTYVHRVRDDDRREWTVRTWEVDRPAEPVSCGGPAQRGRSIVGELIPAS